MIMMACLMLVATSNAFASSDVTTTAGEAVIVDDTSAANNDLTFTPSPTSLMGYITTANAFTLVSWSLNNQGNENGMAYCTSSNGNNIFKQSIENYTPTTPTAAGTTESGFE